MQNLSGLNDYTCQYRVSSYVFRSLPLAATGKVHSVFANSFNLWLANQLIHIGSEEDPLSCIGLTIPKTELQSILDHIEQENLVSLKHNIIFIYTVFSVFSLNLSLCKVVCLEIPRCTLQSLLRLEFEEMNLESKLGIAIDSRFTKECRILSKPHVFQEEMEAIHFLLGRGLGLTPAGDDILMGYGTTLHAFSSQWSFFSSLKKILDVQTTDISLAYLKAMINHQANEDWIRLFSAIHNNETHLKPFLLAISKKGHTSGCDSLYGMQLAISYLQAEEQT